MRIVSVLTLWSQVTPIPTIFATLVPAPVLVARENPLDTVVHHGSQYPRCIATYVGAF